jgi:hypothetical protein
MTRHAASTDSSRNGLVAKRIALLHRGEDYRPWFESRCVHQIPPLFSTTSSAIDVRRGKAQWPAAFELRRMATVGVWQTQANRAKFSGMPVNKVARHAEGARQFTDRHEGKSSESVIFSKRPPSRRPPTIAAESSAPTLQHRGEFMCRVYNRSSRNSIYAARRTA